MTTEIDTLGNPHWANFCEQIFYSDEYKHLAYANSVEEFKTLLPEIKEVCKPYGFTLHYLEADHVVDKLIFNSEEDLLMFKLKF